MLSSLRKRFLVHLQRSGQRGSQHQPVGPGPHGIRKQEGAGDQLGLGGSLPATCFPTAATIANSWDPANAPDALSSLLKKINIGVGIGLAIIELLAILCLVKGRKKE